MSSVAIIVVPRYLEFSAGSVRRYTCNNVRDNVFKCQLFANKYKTGNYLLNMLKFAELYKTYVSSTELIYISLCFLSVKKLKNT